MSLTAGQIDDAVGGSTWKGNNREGAASYDPHALVEYIRWLNDSITRELLQDETTDLNTPGNRSRLHLQN